MQEVGGTEHPAMGPSAEPPLCPARALPWAKIKRQKKQLGKSQGSQCSVRAAEAAPLPLPHWEDLSFCSATEQILPLSGAIHKEPGMAGEKLWEKIWGGGG